jgi:sulfate/thiosulfate transport system permease protein
VSIRPPLLGISLVWLSVMVLLPLAALVSASTDSGLSGFWDAVSNREAISALKFTLLVSIAVAALNAVTGTLIAWVLVRDEFRGKSLVNALIDLPFALPTIVAGLTLLALYGPKGPAPVDVAFTKWAVLFALLFVTLPFVVRSVQPVLMELDREAEEAAASLGAGAFTTFRRIILPALAPAIVSGAGLALGRALGEFGSVVLISGNIPFKTEVGSVFIYNRIQSGDQAGAAAVSVVLLAASLVLLTGLNFAGRRWSR